MSLAVAGAGSKIAQEFLTITGAVEPHVHIAKARGLPLDCNRYLICTGYLAGKSVDRLSRIEAADTFDLNFVDVAVACDRILSVNQTARICVIGSESGESGSYDMAYAGAKAALHLFVRNRRLKHPGQMIVALAPHIIADAGMTTRRVDLPETLERGRHTRLGRWLTSREVANMAYDILYRWPTSMSGQVVRMRAD